MERLRRLKDKLRLEAGMKAAGEEGGRSPLDTVRRIIRDVRDRGDQALTDYTEKLDGPRLSPEQLRVPPEEVERAVEQCPPEFISALKLAADRIDRFQRSILSEAPEALEEDGRATRIRYRPVDSAAAYVPGGTASLASTVLMTLIPARVAGVERLVMATPPLPDGGISAGRLVAASVAGVEEIYRLGGAQAIAALAFGTDTVRPVDFIAGPGNIYVTLAKKEVFGQVGIEMLPGPSEVVVIADETAEPAWIAADLIAQAEHNPGAAILLTDAEGLARAVSESLEVELRDLPKGEAARACLRQYGALVVAASIGECIELANRLAPEHLEIVTRDPEAVLREVRHAGAIFLGPWTPESVGDYVAGPSHVLPTGGTARFSSGLSANDFLKRSSVISYAQGALEKDADTIARLARAEGLEGHARAALSRTESL
ncbi:MAG: histidinol dehydrogenase [Planctomycetes bacterium]|nr:histidinol dehydrogenase [Planctomycetota bacterium]